MPRPTLAALAALLTGPALANVPPPATPPQPFAWDVGMEEELSLDYGNDDDAAISILCPEGMKQLRISVTPAWEVGYGKPDGSVFNGPTDKITVSFGDKTFEAVQDPSMQEEMSYVMTADADSVTAVMLAKNAKVTLASDAEQTREGTSDEGGAFDMFATTCAQINGLK